MRSLFALLLAALALLAAGCTAQIHTQETLYLSSMCTDQQQQSIVGDLFQLRQDTWENLQLGHAMPAPTQDFVGIDTSAEWPPGSGYVLLGGNFLYSKGGILFKNLLCYAPSEGNVCPGGTMPSSMLPDDGPVQDLYVYTPPEGSQDVPTLFVAGQFTTMADKSTCSGLIKVEWRNNDHVISCASNGLTFGSPSDDPNAGISAIIPESSNAFWVGGKFTVTNSGGQDISNLAYYDGNDYNFVDANIAPVTASELHVTASSSVFFATSTAQTALVRMATRNEDGGYTVMDLGSFTTKTGSPLVRSLTLQGDTSTFQGYLLAGGEFSAVDGTALTSGLASLTVSMISKSPNPTWNAPKAAPNSGFVFHITRSVLNPDVVYLTGKGLQLGGNDVSLLSYTENDRDDVVTPFDAPSSNPVADWASTCQGRFVLPIHHQPAPPPPGPPSNDEGNATAAAMAAVFGSAGLVTVVFFSLVLGYKRLGPVDPPL